MIMMTAVVAGPPIFNGSRDDLAQRSKEEGKVVGDHRVKKRREGRKWEMKVEYLN